LGRRAFVELDEADIVVDAGVSPAVAGRRNVAVTLRSIHGVLWGQRLVAVEAQCTAVEEALVLMLSLTVDIQREEVEEREHRDRLRSVRWGPAATLTAVSGLLPGFAWGPGLAFGVQSPLLGWLDLGVTLLLPKERVSVVGARYDAALLALRSCPLQLHAANTSLGACASLRGGIVSGEGLGFDTSFRERRGVASLGLGARGAWEPSEPLFVGAALGVEATLQGSEFYYESAAGRVDLFSTARALFIAELSFGLRL
jgi:hypothetical protein